MNFTFSLSVIHEETVVCFLFSDHFFLICCFLFWFFCCWSFGSLVFVFLLCFNLYDFHICHFIQISYIYYYFLIYCLVFQ